ncbi:hypothetical protein ABT144_33345 [Streptomyces sp. NPDC002039]|uniref:hypothetical protein n=1 Tax=Streptomyces sp. NPDC002039 TaxID=3154660 RepID=UPI00332E9FDA
MGRLDDKRFNGYLGMRIPHDLDQVVNDYISTYRSASNERRGELVGAVSPRAASVLSVYGQRMAVEAVRRDAEEPLERAVVAVGIAEQRLPDPRENVIVLGAVHHSAELLGTSLAQIVARVSDTLPPASVLELQRFVQRDEKDKSLKAMRLRSFGTGETFIYVSGG